MKPIKVITYILISSIGFFNLRCKHRDANDLKETSMVNLVPERYKPVEELFTFEMDEDALDLLGDWEAVSNNHVAICGDMRLDTALISFEKKGDVTFQIWHKTEEEWILKINKDVDDGLFMRIGPVVGANSYRSQMEVAYYATQEDAMASRFFPADHATSWGIYTRKRS